jgi:hypothetical protein
MSFVWRIGDREIVSKSFTPGLLVILEKLRQEPKNEQLRTENSDLATDSQNL